MTFDYELNPQPGNSAQMALPMLPPDTVLQYFAEGAANIVYRISIQPRSSTPTPSVLEEYGDSTPPPSIIEGPSISDPFKNKLLRLRKDIPTTAPCAIAQANWERLIKPLFPVHQLVDQTLIRIRPGTIAKLNEELRAQEVEEHAIGFFQPDEVRPIKRRGTYLAEDDHGLLVTDMTPCSEEELIEFKPKWLIQSPSAPRASQRCRQCARTARINAERATKMEATIRSFCPLDLTSQNLDQLFNVARLILRPGTRDSQIQRFVYWLENTDILQNLKTRQMELDQVGVMVGNASDENLLAAMTLRDCTMYIKCTTADPKEWVAKIGDLDLKMGTKLAYWRTIEKSLIDEGWYEGTENGDKRQLLDCHLSSKRYRLP